MPDKDEAENGMGHKPPKNAEVKSFIERIESLEEDKKELSEDIKQVKLDASEAGIPTKELNEILRQRKMQRKMGKEAYEEYLDGVSVLKDSLGQSYWAFDQTEMDMGDGAAVH